jgi:hypothetical protein
MPVYRRPKGSALGARVWVLGALALAWGVGCFFDLDVPTVPATPPPPTISFLSPRQGDTINLTGQVSVAADSVNGVSSVTLLCGPLDAGARQVYAWATPPYLALVDFSACQGLTTPVDGGFPTLQLIAQAVSDAGAPNQATVQVLLNAAAPQLTAVFPPTAQPKSPFTVVVSSDLQLSALPVVTLAGASADSVVALSSPPGGPYSYSAFFQSTPGLGTDNYPQYQPGVPVPIELLTQTDLLVRLTVEGTVANGNSSALDLSVDLSRVVWDRYIPGVPAENNPIVWAAEPVVFDGGLVLPLATTSGGDATSAWIPGVLSKDDGTFYGFDNSLLPDGGLDGGYQARGITLSGATLFFQVVARSSNLVLVPAPPARTPIVTSLRLGNILNSPLTTVSGAGSVPDLLCLPDAITQCSDSNFESVSCLAPDLTIVTSATPGVSFTGPPDAGVVAGGGGRYFSPSAGPCGSMWNLADFATGVVTLGSENDPNGVARNCFMEGINRLLAVGDGTFVIQATSSCEDGTTQEFPILRVGAGSTILGAYTAPLTTPRPVPREVVGVLADGRVVTVRNTPPSTTFELWPLNGATDVPDVTSPIAGLYDSADSTESSVVARSVYSHQDGSFAALLSGAPLGVGVIAFGPNLKPLWLYLYPRVTSTGNSRLISSPRHGDVYLIDTFNNRAVSLRVVPPASP